MRYDLFAEFSFGKIAIKKIKPENPDFRQFEAGFAGDGNQREEMKITGAVFRESQNGPNKGTLSIKVPQSSRTVYVTVAEIAAFEKASASPGELRSEGEVANGDFASLRRFLELAVD